MNKFGFVSTQRNSVNSSFSTVKNGEFTCFNDTTNKQIQNKRFSYQEINNNHQQTNQKQNKRINSIPVWQMYCINHQSNPALFTALQKSDDPMYLCERCAIMVASKGFQINKIQEMKVKSNNSSLTQFKKDINDTFNCIKTRKNQSLQKLVIFSNKLDKQIAFLEQYFGQIHDFIEGERLSFLKEICSKKKQIEIIRQQSNNFYIAVLQKIKQIGEQSSLADYTKLKDLNKDLKNLKKKNHEIVIDSLKYPLKLKNINQVCLEIANIFKNKQWKQLQTDSKFKLKCEEQNSEIRSLQLSFQQQNNFTLNIQQANNKARDSNLLSSIDLF